MRSSTWDALHEQLVRSTQTLRFQKHFEAMRQRRKSLAPFVDPAALLDYLTDPLRALDQEPDKQKREEARAAALDNKDLIYGDLIREEHARTPQSQPATTLITLGLWPGLDSTRSGLLKYFPHEEPELTARLIAQFQRHVAMANLDRMKRVAATLVMNTRRDVRNAREVELSIGGRNLPLENENGEAGAASVEPVEPPDDKEPKLADKIRQAIGADTELVLLVLVEEISIREACDLLELPFETGKKRYQRALKRLRSALEASRD